MVRDLPKFDDPNLIVGPEGGSDAGVYKLRDDLLIVQSLDFFPPLVDDPYVYGQIAAANSISDVYAMGGAPTTALNIVGFPDDKLEISILNEILKGGAERIQTSGAVVSGGHTVRDVEVKYGLSVTGIVHPDHLMTNRDAKPGDVLVLTKSLGTGFITTAFKQRKCPDDVLAAAVASMIQLNGIGAAGARKVSARAATDITGFGFAGHAMELADSSNVTLAIDIEKLPLLPGAEALASQGNLTRATSTNRVFVEPHIRMEGEANKIRMEMMFDPQTSGGLLICVAAERAEELVEMVQASGATSTVIVGKVLDREEASLVVRS